MKKKRIAIGVPCYNEEKAIPLFVSTLFADEGFRRLQEKYDFCLIFTDDGSKDNTLPILESLAKENPNLYFISFDKNRGKEAGLVALYNAALTLKVDALVKMDVDMQDPPSLLPEFIEAWEKGYVYVYGHCPGRKGQKLIKKLFSMAFYSFYHWISLEGGMKDGDRDYALLDPTILPRYASLVGPYRFDRSIASHLKLNSTRVVYPFVNREDGTTRWPFKRLLKYSFNAFRQFDHLNLFLDRIVLELLFVSFVVLLTLSVVYNTYLPALFSSSMAALFFFSLGLLQRLHTLDGLEERLQDRYKDYEMYKIKKTNLKEVQTKT